jgi:hypothetical protein
MQINFYIALLIPIQGIVPCFYARLGARVRAAGKVKTSTPSIEFGFNPKANVWHMA